MYLSSSILKNDSAREYLFNGNNCSYKKAYVKKTVYNLVKLKNLLKQARVLNLVLMLIKQFAILNFFSGLITKQHKC